MTKKLTEKGFKNPTPNALRGLKSVKMENIIT